MMLFNVWVIFRAGNLNSIAVIVSPDIYFGLSEVERCWDLLGFDAYLMVNPTYSLISWDSQKYAEVHYTKRDSWML